MCAQSVPRERVAVRRLQPAADGEGATPATSAHGESHGECTAVSAPQ